MNIAGVIAEYNPFHKGHQYHLAMTRQITGCDYLVVCMDGAFTQRGEAACLDLHTRAKMALTCGADAVFLLPTLYAVRTADVFAASGVAILGKLGCDYLSFGSETGDLNLLRQLALLRENEPADLAASIQNKLALGMSHARARGEALSEYLQLPAEMLSAPNAILGCEYIRAIDRMGLEMKPVAIERSGNYHDERLCGDFASAQAIRSAMKTNKAAAAGHVPASLREWIIHAPSMHAADDLLLYILRTMSEAEIAQLPDVSEGLERRVKRFAASAASQDELIDAIKCKRYTRARLSRLCTHALLGLNTKLTNAHPSPEYAYLVGMRSGAEPLLRALADRSELPILSDASKLSDDEVFALECRAADLRALMCSEPSQRRSGRMFTEKFVRV